MICGRKNLRRPACCSRRRCGQWPGLILSGLVLYGLVLYAACLMPGLSSHGLVKSGLILSSLVWSDPAWCLACPAASASTSVGRGCVNVGVCGAVMGRVCLPGLRMGVCICGCGLCVYLWLWSLVDWFVGRVGVEICGTVSLVDWFVVAVWARVSVGRCRWWIGLWVVWAWVFVETGRWSRRNQGQRCVWLVHKF